MSGEQSVRSGEASNFRQVLERPSPDSTSFRSELLSDMESHKAHRTKAHKSPSHRRHRSHRDRDHTIEGRVLEVRQLSRLLAHDEVESVEMRRVLSRTSERLEQETRRANEAEGRARDAEARALEMQIAKRKVEVELLREQETLRAYHSQLEVARKEIIRAQKELDDMAAEKEKVEQAAAKDRSNARAMAKEIEIRQALEQGRQEGKTQGFVEGRTEGWYIGTRDGRREALLELEQRLYGDDAESASSGSSDSRLPPATSGIRAAEAAPRPPPLAETLRGGRNRSGSSLAPKPKVPLRQSPDPKASSAIRSAAAPASVRAVPSSEHLADRSSPALAASSTSRDPGRRSPAPGRGPGPAPHYPPPSPRPTQTSPLPSGYIPLKENGRVSLPAPHGIEPPPSPHSPAAPLPPGIPPNDLLGPILHPQSSPVIAAPIITVQEPTPPEPSVTMPEPHPAPPVDNNIKPSRVLSRDYAFESRDYAFESRDYAFEPRAESPPLPPLPTERGHKGKQRQRLGRPRTGAGLHAPGRSSPSDTSTEFSQFDIVTGATEPQERARLNMSLGNGSQLSVIMEGGSTVAESPEPAQAPSTIGVKQYPTPRIGGNTPLNMAGDLPRPPSRLGILDDPREYGDIAEAQLSPSQLIRRQAIAEQIRWTPPDDMPETTRELRNIKDDVSIRSSTSATRASAPRRPSSVRVAERLGPSRDVQVLEKQAEMYDAFGTGQFPSFDSPSPPDDAASARASPNFKAGHRNARSSISTVPGITIQPPSRPSSHGSKISMITGGLSLHLGPAPIPVPGTPSRRHSLQGSSITPSMVPLPLTTAQVPIPLMPPNPGQFTLPPGFQPTHGPAEVVGDISSMVLPKTPRAKTSTMSTKTPKMTTGGLGSPSFPAYTPAGIPLPLSTTTTTRGLPDNASSGARETDQTPHFFPPVATSYEPAPLPPGLQYPSSFGAARVPLPESVVGSPHGSVVNQTPWGGWGGLGVGNTPGSSMPATLSADRPMALYAGDGGANRKVSSSSAS